MIEFVEFIKDMFKYLIVIVVILLIRVFIISTTEVVGNSMNPNLNNGNILLVDQVFYKLSGLKRFDVISFKSKPSHLVKRIIGLPGETIEYEDNILYINNKKIKERFNLLGSTNDFGPVVIPKDNYFVLGDNREDSTDSRVFGTIKVNIINGKCFFSIWPLNQIKIVK